MHSGLKWETFLITGIIFLLFIVLIFFLYPFTQNKRITFWANLGFAFIGTFLLLAVISAFTGFLSALFSLVRHFERSLCSPNFLLYLFVCAVTGLLFALLLYIFLGYTTSYINGLANRS